jgi:NAD(P)-dependent dehydrogenase (short-subunit alcohol dehydrogenase family)
VPERRKVALVTGGAVRIGRAVTRAIAAAGYDVAIHMRSERAECAEALAEVEATGRRAALLYAELSDPADVARLIPEAMAALGPVQLLVNNASEFHPDAVGALEVARWDRHLAVNLRAPVFLAEALANALPIGMGGAVVNIVDQRVLKPTPNYLSYAVAKSALWSATRMLAQGLAPRVRVNAVAPGPTLRSINQSVEDFARQHAAVALGRGPSPEEIASAVVFLAGAPSVTGQMLAVDGGQHLAWQTEDTVVD